MDIPKTFFRAFWELEGKFLERSDTLHFDFVDSHHDYPHIGISVPIPRIDSNREAVDPQALFSR